MIHDPAISNGVFTTGIPRDVSVALVHDWLPVYAGAERVFGEMIRSLPGAELFSLINFLPRDQQSFLQGRSVHTSFIQHLPFAKNRHRYYLPLAPLAIEQFNLNTYDVVVSSSYVVAKGVMTTADQLHISYIHSPIRYAWDQQFHYLQQGKLERGVKSAIARMILHYMRLYDVVSANRVDVFVASSHNVARRIWKTYRRDAQIIYPPVDIDAFSLESDKDDYYLTLSRLATYKRVDLIVEAFREMPDKELIVIGDGPEIRKIAAKAGPNVTLLGYQPFEAVRHYMQHAKAFVFAAEEDFGIVPVEAQACGTPVIAYGKGGVRETVIPDETGIFFDEQNIRSLKLAVDRFEEIEFDPYRIRANVERFGTRHFQLAFTQLIEQQVSEFSSGAFAKDGSFY